MFNSSNNYILNIITDDSHIAIYKSKYKHCKGINSISKSTKIC